MLVHRHWVHLKDWELAMWIAKDFLLYCCLIFAFAGAAAMLVVIVWRRSDLVEFSPTSQAEHLAKRTGLCSVRCSLTLHSWEPSSMGANGDVLVRNPYACDRIILESLRIQNDQT